MPKSLNNSYIVFENSHECDALIQLSTSLSTLEVEKFKFINL